MKKSNFKNIVYDDVRRIINDPSIIIIDVRTEEEYKKSHIRRSINIPLDGIEKNIVNIIKNKNQKIIVYCAVGIRSIVACEILLKLGYKDVVNVYGGVKEL